MSYTSPLPHEPTRLRAAAVYCSDGRFGEHVDDFVQNALGLPHYDRIALPGGAACLANDPDAFVSETSVAEALRFLVEAHDLQRVILISHQGCGLYGARYQEPADEIEERQRRDLAAAARMVSEITGLDAVERWFLRVDGETVSFERFE